MISVYEQESRHIECITPQGYEPPLKYYSVNIFEFLFNSYLCSHLSIKHAFAVSKKKNPDCFFSLYCTVFLLHQSIYVHFTSKNLSLLRLRCVYLLTRITTRMTITRNNTTAVKIRPITVQDSSEPRKRVKVKIMARLKLLVKFSKIPPLQG